MVKSQPAAYQTGGVLDDSMSDLKQVAWGKWDWAALFTAPSFLWLASLFLAIRVFVPPLVSPEAKGPSKYDEILQGKYRLLMISQYALLIGLLVMVICVVLYFVYIPPPPPPK